MEDRGPSAYVAELVGTFMLVLFIALIAERRTHAKASALPTSLMIGLLHAFRADDADPDARGDLRRSLQPRGHAGCWR